MVRFFSIAFLVVMPVAVLAQVSTTATQTVYLEVRPVALLEVSGDPQPMTVATGQAGVNGLNTIEERSTSYRLTTNASDMKLSVAIDQPVPAGIRLFIELGAATGSSSGKLDISDAVAPVDAVTGISSGWAGDEPIVYSFEADADRQALAPESRTVILTLTN